MIRLKYCDYDGVSDLVSYVKFHPSGKFPQNLGRRRSENSNETSPWKRVGRHSQKWRDDDGFMSQNTQDTKKRGARRADTSSFPKPHQFGKGELFEYRTVQCSPYKHRPRGPDAVWSCSLFPCAKACAAVLFSPRECCWAGSGRLQT